jgi:hypothetical protein
VPWRSWSRTRRVTSRGGYYIGLVTPLLLYAAAVATVRLASRLATKLPWGDAAATRVAATLALVVATVVRSAPGDAPPGDRSSAPDRRRDTRRRLADLYQPHRFRPAHGVRARALPVRTLSPWTVRRPVRQICVAESPPPAGAATASTDGRGAYVAISYPAPEQRPCLEALARRCRNLGAADAHDWVLLRCAP